MLKISVNSILFLRKLSTAISFEALSTTGEQEGFWRASQPSFKPGNSLNKGLKKVS